MRTCFPWNIEELTVIIFTKTWNIIVLKCNTILKRLSPTGTFHVVFNCRTENGDWEYASSVSAPIKGQSRQSLVVISNDSSMPCGVQDAGDEDSVLCVFEENYRIVLLRSNRYVGTRFRGNRMQMMSHGIVQTSLTVDHDATWSLFIVQRHRKMPAQPMAFSHHLSILDQVGFIRFGVYWVGILTMY